MYGYIRPVRSELKVRNDGVYKAAYCGLCHALKTYYGPAARFTVSYDMTLALMLLSGNGGEICRRRCPVHPLRGRHCLCGMQAEEKTAGYTVILAYRKLEDKRLDGGFGERLAAGLGMLFLRSAYRKAAAKEPHFDQTAADELSRLHGLEREHCAEPDRTADTFASILSAMAEGEENDGRRRILTELFYHLGRSVYLLDALDDHTQDVSDGSYNVYRFRYGDTLTEEQKTEILGTLNLSQHRICRAAELLERTEFSDILDNIFSLGIPQAAALVAAGRWGKRGRKETE